MRTTSLFVRRSPRKPASETNTASSSKSPKISAWMKSTVRRSLEIDARRESASRRALRLSVQLLINSALRYLRDNASLTVNVNSARAVSASRLSSVRMSPMKRRVKSTRSLDYASTLLLRALVRIELTVRNSARVLLALSLTVRVILAVCSSKVRASASH